MIRKTRAILAALLAAGCASAVEHQPPVIEPKLQALEARSGGRLGVAIADNSGRVIGGHRAGERFAFCSTFKLLLGGMVLDANGEGRLTLDERLEVSEADLVFHSPVTKTRTGDGWITVGDAARAMVTVSDNAAANLLIERLGGAQAFNTWLRQLGDPATRLDRAEPALNSNHPGDPRDTTTPAAMASSATKLIFGDRLRPSERALLRQWLTESETGLDRIRAGLPESFVAGDKTGTCGGGSRASFNDVAFIVPVAANSDQGYVIAAYLDRPTTDGDAAKAALAAVGEAATANMLSRR